jgi:hypothetical protein
MKLFGFTSSKTVDAFAKELAHEFANRYPLSGKKELKKSSLEKQIERSLSEFYAKAKAFKQEHKLGVFKRARLAKTFQDEMRVLGYDADTVTKITTGLVTVALSGK